MLDQNGIYITKKQASVTAALLILLSLLIFIAGYFWGKHSIIDGFTQKASQESFNDQVDYLLTMQSFAAKHGALSEDVETSSDSPESSAEKLLQKMPDALEETGKVEEVETVPDTTVQDIESSKANVALKLTGKHYAALAGFAKKASAVSMINRLKKYKIDLELKTKISKSTSGKSTKAWYQVVTKKMENQDDLQKLIDKVISIEHIKRKDVKIV